MKTYEQILKEIYERKNCAMFGVISPCMVGETNSWSPVVVCECASEARKLILEQTMTGIQNFL